MPKYYKREDIERFFNGFPFGKEEIHFSIMDILNNLDSIPTVNALELNEDLEIMLKQLGYEKVKNVGN